MDHINLNIEPVSPVVSFVAASGILSPVSISAARREVVVTGSMINQSNWRLRAGTLETNVLCILDI